MAVCIRLSRFGRLHRPYFRIVAIDRRNHREGVANEVLGSYDPQLPDKNVQVNLDRVQAWVNQGALISPSLKNLLKFSGYQVPVTTAAAAAKTKAKPPAKAKAAAPKPTKKGTYVAPSRRAVRKHQAKLKAVRKVATAEADAKAKAAKAAAAPAAPAEPAAETPKA